MDLRVSDTHPPPKELFHYAAPYKVLICTTCRYAIQPTGITRHLKDIHHIYRGARRPYVAYANNLELKSPEDVNPPSIADQFPIAYLPVEDGWHCAAPGCDYMCLSIKRMETHWPATHGRKGIHAKDWAGCRLQTFFRGNMLRYFTQPVPSSCQVETQKTSLATLQNVREENNASTESCYMSLLREKYTLNSSASFILEHYFSLAYKNFMVDDDGSERIWLDIVPRLALDNYFLMYGILACTALHMAYLDPSKREAYTLQACAYQDDAIPLYREAMKNPSRQNCNAIVAFAHLLVVWSFAVDTDNQSNPLLLVDTPWLDWADQRLIIPQWLHFIRAGCSMLCDVWDTVETGPVRALAYSWEVEPIVGEADLPYLEYFMSLIPNDGSWTADSIATYSNAAAALAESFAHVNNTERNPTLTTWKVLAVWPARIEDEYMTLLADRHPGALILLAYFCIILKRIDELWYFHGRPAKLVASILQSLDERWQPAITEVVDQVLGQRDMNGCI